MKRASRLTSRIDASHRFHSSVRRAFRHSRNSRRRGSRRSVVRGSSRPGRGLEILLTVDAVAVAALRRPPIREDAVHAVGGHDLAMDLVHEVEVVGTKRAGDPQLGIRPVAPWLSVTVDGNPIRVRGLHLIANGMWIRPRDDVHAQAATSRNQRPERIGTAQPGAAMVERHLRRVVGDNAAGAERRGVGVKAAEVVDPELRIETAGIVFDQRQLHPTHRTIEPTLEGAGCGVRDAGQCGEALAAPASSPSEANADAPAVTCRKSRREIESGMNPCLLPFALIGGCSIFCDSFKRRARDYTCQSS